MNACDVHYVCMHPSKLAGTITSTFMPEFKKKMWHSCSS